MRNWISGLFAPSKNTSGAKETDDPRVCSIALLVEIALADGIYAEIEQAKIIHVIEQSFGIMGADALELLNQGEACAANAIDHYTFTRTIKKQLPKEQRAALIGHLWDIALADGEQSAFEDALIRRLAPLLAIGDHERAAAKRAAQARAAKKD